MVPNGSFEEFKPTDNPYAPKKFKDLAGDWEAFSNTVSRNYQPDIAVYKENTTYPDGNVILHYFNFQAVKSKELIKTIFQVKLSTELIKDSDYRFSFYYKLTSPEKVTDDSIIDSRLIQFSTINNRLKNLEEIDKLNKDALIGVLPKGKSMQSYHDGKWYNANYEFKAKGEEKYLIFGTFDTHYTKYWCLFYFDDVKLEPISKTISIFTNIEVGSSFVMENILFETNKSILKESSYKPLNQLISELNKNPKLKLEISGHTDNTGTNEHNQILSEQRAKAVVNYLVKNGTATNRLTFKGYGSSKPIADNQTDVGKEKNRRVEMMVVDK